MGAMRNSYLVRDIYKPFIRNTLKITKSRTDNILNTISLILRKIFVSGRILFPAKSKAILICPYWPSAP